MTKEGPGSLTFNGTGAYSAATDVFGGTLVVATKTALPPGGTVIVGANAQVFDASSSSAPVWDPNSVQALQPSGTYGAGSEIEIAVPLSGIDTVSGSPELALALGTTTRYAQYAGGSGTSTWFDYVVQPGDGTAVLD